MHCHFVSESWEMIPPEWMEEYTLKDAHENLSLSLRGERRGNIEGEKESDPATSDLR